MQGSAEVTHEFETIYILLCTVLKIVEIAKHSLSTENVSVVDSLVTFTA
jgi:hypothetical protein